MSLFNKLFGGKDGKEQTPQESIQKLRELEEILGRKSEFLEKKIENEIGTAKKNIKNKRVALQALKRKKKYEQQLTQIDGTLTNLEFQREALENAKTNAEVFKVMGEASKSLKGVHKGLNIDQVQDIMDDLAEQHEISNEISEAISNPLNIGGMVMDDDELAAELEELEQEELDREMLNVGNTATDLPSVPSTALPTPAAAATEDDDAELRELQAWAN